MMLEKNMISYNTVVDDYAKNLNPKEAFQLFHEIEVVGVGTSAFTYASLLSGAASIGAIGKGEQIHASAFLTH
jgi:pentatricopeptide repeat protein